MVESFWQAFNDLSLQSRLFLGFALFVAFAFEFINGFHDTANAVTTVIYTKTLKPTPAVLFSGFCNFLGVILGGTAVAFSIVHLLPTDVLTDNSSTRLIVMVISLLLAGVTWNLGTWWYGLPVSSSHTLIGSILGVGLANSLLTRGDMSGVNWVKAMDVAKALLLSPLIGFIAAASLLIVMKKIFRDPRLHTPPGEGEEPPSWIRGVLLATCGGVSFAHGSNDGQKGMGLILLSLIGFLPSYFAFDMSKTGTAQDLKTAAVQLQTTLADSSALKTGTVSSQLDQIVEGLGSASSFGEVDPQKRWEVRHSILELDSQLKKASLSASEKVAVTPLMKKIVGSTEYVPLWVVIGVALALGIGTTIGYKRIVVTVAEKIGKTHMTYAQGAAAEVVAATTIGLADIYHLPVSTTHVLSSGVAGSMWANKSGLQGDTVKKIGLAWILTLPAAIFLSAFLFSFGSFLLVPSKRLEAATSVPQRPVAPASESEASKAVSGPAGATMLTPDGSGG